MEMMTGCSMERGMDEHDKRFCAALYREPEQKAKIRHRIALKRGLIPGFWALRWSPQGLFKI